MKKHNCQIHNIVIIQDQVLLGSILGGSSLIKPPKGVNYYLSMRCQNEQWLLYKMAEMRSYFGGCKPHWYTNTFRVNSICHEFLSSCYNSMYDGNKRKVTMELLDKLMDMGLAVWYLDGGSKTGRGKKNAYINTTRFGDEGAEIVWQFFNGVDMPCSLNKEGNRSKVLFTVNGTEMLFSTIAHKIPNFMLNRIL